MKLIIITGQTATGKTKYALELAGKYNGELINADSRQIYKHLDIITGKDIPKNSENNSDIGYYELSTNNSQPSIKIWLYDIVDPKIYFSSFDFVQCALPVIKDILQRGKTPIIIGGTYFYLYHLLYDVQTQLIPADWKLRHKLNEKSVTELQSVMKEIAPQFINKLSRSEINNPQRLIRKIEILRYRKKYHLPSTPLHIFKAKQPIGLGKKLNMDVDIEYHGFKYKHKEKLKKAIKFRVEKRLEEGAIKEVRNLIKIGYGQNDPGFKTIGYKQIIAFLKKKLSKEQAVKTWITEEIRYAKRQYTFMKRDLHIRWHDIR